MPFNVLCQFGHVVLVVDSARVCTLLVFGILQEVGHLTISESISSLAAASAEVLVQDASINVATALWVEHSERSQQHLRIIRIVSVLTHVPQHHLLESVKRNCAIWGRPIIGQLWYDCVFQVGLARELAQVAHYVSHILC